MDKELDHRWVERVPAESPMTIQALSLVLMVIRFTGLALLELPNFLAAIRRIFPAEN